MNPLNYFLLKAKHLFNFNDQLTFFHLLFIVHYSRQLELWSMVVIISAFDSYDFWSTLYQKTLSNPFSIDLKLN
jgi:hypothetical protein